jgi:DNA/RNA-binding domain of Phe-tRNA-synthetase-like protein
LQNENVRKYNEFIATTKSVIKQKTAGSEILINLIKEKGSLPSISRVVDCMNIISVKYGLTISVWDQDKLNGDITYKISKGGDKYWPFMGDEVKLLKGELIAQDRDKVICLVRYRDSKYAPVTVDTKNIVVHIQGVNGIKKEVIEKALTELKELLLENVGGDIKLKFSYK